jgi:hypothetical protein
MAAEMILNVYKRLKTKERNWIGATDNIKNATEVY